MLLFTVNVRSDLICLSSVYLCLNVRRAPRVINVSRHVSWEDPKQSAVSVSLITSQDVCIFLWRLWSSSPPAGCWRHALIPFVCSLVSVCWRANDEFRCKSADNTKRPLVKHSPLFRSLSRTWCYLMFFWSWLLGFLHHKVVIKRLADQFIKAGVNATWMACQNSHN